MVSHYTYVHSIYIYKQYIQSHICTQTNFPDVPCRFVGRYGLLVPHYIYVCYIYIYKQYVKYPTYVHNQISQTYLVDPSGCMDCWCRIICVCIICTYRQYNSRIDLSGGMDCWCLIIHMCITYIYIYKQYIQYTRMYTIRFPRESERARERESERESVCVRTIKFPDLVDSSGGIDCWCLITFICIIYMYM